MVPSRSGEDNRAGIYHYMITRVGKKNSE